MDRLRWRRVCREWVQRSRTLDRSHTCEQRHSTESGYEAIQQRAAERRAKVASMAEERDGLVRCEFCNDLMPKKSMAYHVASCQRLSLMQKRLSALNRRTRLHNLAPSAVGTSSPRVSPPRACRAQSGGPRPPAPAAKASMTMHGDRVEAPPIRLTELLPAPVDRAVPDGARGVTMI